LSAGLFSFIAKLPGSGIGVVRGRERKFHRVVGANKVRPTLYARICDRSGIPRPNQCVNGTAAAAGGGGVVGLSSLLQPDISTNVNINELIFLFFLFS